MLLMFNERLFSSLDSIHSRRRSGLGVSTMASLGRVRAYLNTLSVKERRVVKNVRRTSARTPNVSTVSEETIQQLSNSKEN